MPPNLTSQLELSIKKGSFQDETVQRRKDTTLPPW